ncbi:hypothetical protein HMPREF9538_00934, partial [Klebsiella sp. MS 92-3]
PRRGGGGGGAFLLSADIIKTGKILRRCITLDSLIMMMSLP